MIKIYNKYFKIFILFFIIINLLFYFSKNNYEEKRVLNIHEFQLDLYVPKHVNLDLIKQIYLDYKHGPKFEKYKKNLSVAMSFKKKTITFTSYNKNSISLSEKALEDFILYYGVELKGILNFYSKMIRDEKFTYNINDIHLFYDLDKETSLNPKILGVKTRIKNQNSIPKKIIITSLFSFLLSSIIIFMLELFVRVRKRKKIN